MDGCGAEARPPSRACALGRYPPNATRSLYSCATSAGYAPAPGARRRLDVGCEPCARVAALTVLAAVAARAADPASVALALFSVLALGFGLLQRLSDSPTCAVPSAPPH